MSARFVSTAAFLLTALAAPLAAAAPDLIVDQVYLDPVGAAAGSGTIRIVFKNIGPDDVDLSWTEYTNYTVSLSGAECAAGTINDLAAGATNNESTGACNPSVPGTYTITVVIDSDLDVAESNENNNVWTGQVTWGGPDLVITGITLDPAVPDVNEGTLQATIENIGPYGTGIFVNINVLIYLDGVECDSGLIIGGLGAGSSATENTTNCNPSTVGMHTIKYVVDTDGDVAETDETNNEFTATFYWGPPDLTITDITLDPTVPRYDDGTLTATIKNNGNGTGIFVNINLTMYRDGVECDTGILYAGLGTLATATEDSTACRPDKPGTYDITFVVDTDDDVAESDETNNSLTKSFTWSGPDLVITGITRDPVAAAPGEGKLIATIANQGDYGTDLLLNINITMFLDGVECDTGLILAGLGAGSDTTEETTSCNPDTPGQHTIKFVVDSVGEVPETDETNNELEQVFTWCGPTELCNGIDDNCDGNTDEAFQDLGAACDYTSTDPECAAKGVKACGADGSGTVCVLAATDADEVCDSVDNDCDAQTDEEWSELDTACTAGEGACAAAGVYICGQDQESVACDATPGAPGSEVCGNTIDDDCDGATDEDCSCNAGDTQPCGTGEGACQQGVQSCVGGVFSTLCVGEIIPSEELCNTVDDDCDGDTDEGCHCDDPGAQPCPSGTECNTTTGACGAVSPGDQGGPVDQGGGEGDTAGPTDTASSSDLGGGGGGDDLTGGGGGGDGGVTFPGFDTGGGGDKGAADEGCAAGGQGSAGVWLLLLALLALVATRRRSA
jgi:MYXO-CTERM domain-containing protein